jgi:hypothetical protein
VRRSLVKIDEAAIPGYSEAARYQLLDPVRQYGQERLTQAGETGTLRNRHLRWCVALAEQTDRILNGPDQTIWLDRLETEHDNRRPALGWSMRQGASWEQGLRLAGTLARFWNLHGYFTEGPQRANALYTESMALNEAVGYKVGMALQFTMFAYPAQQQGDRARARWCFSESLRRFRDLGMR